MKYEDFGLIEIPEELLTAQKMLHMDLEDNKYFTNVAFVNPTDITIWSKLLLISVMQLTGKPIFTKDCDELDAIRMQELKKIARDEDLDTIIAMQEDFCSNCLVLMNSLTMFGWTRLEELFFNEENSHEAYRTTHLCTYYEYFDELVDLENIYEDVRTFVYTFVNERLGKYQKYAEKHDIDEQLQTTITREFSLITNMFDVSQCVHSVKEYGYEIVYIHSYCPDYERYHDDCFLNVSLLMPIHAANLEKLLDIAFARYPIESEE